MSEPGTFDPNQLKLQPLGPPPGLLDQFNLPPKVITFMRGHHRSLWAVFIAVIALSLSWAGYDAYRDNRQQQATSALDAALLATQDKASQLDKVTAQFAGTDAAQWARVELALLDEREGQVAKAITPLQTINAGLDAKALLKPLLLTKLAALAEREGKLDRALALYTELSSWESFATESYRSRGRVSEQLGNKEEAIAMYTKYLEQERAQSFQSGSNPVRELVQSRLSQLKK